jgi:acetyl esterase
MGALLPGAREYIDRTNAGPPIWELALDEARHGVDAETLEMFGPVDEVAVVEDRLIDGPGGPLRIRLYRHAVAGPLPALVYFHGGGWVVGSLESHDPVCRAIALRTPALVVSVDYRLAPEAPFPAAVEDAWAATAWLARNAEQLEVGEISVGGDSAGGNLAAVVAIRARDRGLALAHQILVYPVIDHDLDSPGYAAYGVGLNLTRAKMEWYWCQYVGSGDAGHPEASPLRAASLAAVAPALVQIAEHDPLAWEGEEYARELEAADVPVRVTRYDGHIHGFVKFGALGLDADRAFVEIATELNARPSA